MRTHYDNLKVSESAPLEVIRAAYRALAQQWHPDKNPSPEAVKITQILNDAYDVLGDPVKRAKYDAFLASKRREQQSTKQDVPPVVPPKPSPSERKWQVLQNDQLLGPYTLPQLTTNLKVRKISVAAYVCELGTSDWMSLGELLDRLKAASPSPAPPSQKKGPIDAGGKATLLVAIGLTIIISALESEKSEKRQKSRPAQPQYALPAKPKYPFPAQPQNTFQAKIYKRPEVTPYGHAWPSSSDYLAGAPAIGFGGLSSLTIDNRQLSSDVHVKLVRLPPCQPEEVVREGMIKGGDSFDFREVATGVYEIRYRDLESGHLAKSEPFTLSEQPTATGTTYTVMTLTLYAVSNGNTRMLGLSEDDF